MEACASEMQDEAGPLNGQIYVCVVNHKGNIRATSGKRADAVPHEAWRRAGGEVQTLQVSPEGRGSEARCPSRLS